MNMTISGLITLDFKWFLNCCCQKKYFLGIASKINTWTAFWNTYNRDLVSKAKLPTNCPRHSLKNGLRNGLHFGIGLSQPTVTTHGAADIWLELCTTLWNPLECRMVLSSLLLLWILNGVLMLHSEQWGMSQLPKLFQGLSPPLHFTGDPR